MQAVDYHQRMPRRRDYADELLRSFPNGRLVNPEGSVVDLPFQLPNGRPTALRVSLPAHFPQERPVLCVLVPLQHPAVDTTGRVRVRGAELWGNSGSVSSGAAAATAGPGGGRAPGTVSGIGPTDLVAVVREAFTVLLGPEAAAQQGLLAGGAAVSSGGVSVGSMPSFGGGIAPGPNTAVGGYGNGSVGTPMPGAGGLGGAAGGAGSGSGGDGSDPESFLEGLPTSVLEAMMGDEEELRRVAAQWLQGTSAARALEDVRRANRSAATANLALARSIEEARGHVAIVRSGEYAAMRALFEELYGRQEAVVAKIGPAAVLARVRQEAEQSDAASDELLERYQSGGLTVEAFVEAYTAAREAFHSLDLKRQAAEHTPLLA
ncbi:hypothetical protein Agub_g11887 [Astrephomene gubernaculifera]|uniref:VPS37 C-terminal domain-containing protein n=1 Tax=Astrephomene gubernaculifera TaxID=47775 RepID=A0AAD3HR99_9CHLO|nr:hypothetical protein Agub_g11887 [Astrephomene gubernaculifera]